MSVHGGMVPSILFTSVFISTFLLPISTNTMIIRTTSSETFGTSTKNTVSTASNVTRSVGESSIILQKEYTSQQNTDKDKIFKNIFRFKRRPVDKASGYDNNKESGGLASRVTTTSELGTTASDHTHQHKYVHIRVDSENSAVLSTHENSTVSSTFSENSTTISFITKDNPIIDDTTVSSTMTEDSTVSSTITEDSTESSTITNDTTVPSTITEDTTMSSTITEDTTVSSTITEDTTVSSTITEDTTVSSTITKDTTMSSAITEDTTMSSTITEDTTVSSTITEDTTVSSTITEDTTVSSTITEDTTVSSTITEDTPITEESTVSSTITEDTTVSSIVTDETTPESTSEQVSIETTTEGINTDSTTDLVTKETTVTTTEEINSSSTHETTSDINTTTGTHVPTTGGTEPPEVDRDVSIEIVAGILGVLLLAGLIATGAVMYRQGKLPWKARTSQGSVRPHPIHLSRFETQCSQLLETPARLGSEFQLLQTLSADLVDTNTFVAAQLPDNKKKNRYINILPYDLTRVKLEVTNDDPSDYINASYIKGYTNTVEYIASQGPKDETLDDFWRMMYQHNVRVVAMVTNFEEGGKRKCEPYFPKLRDQMLVGDSIIRCTTELQFPMYTQRTIVLLKDDKKRSITHLHFNEWPDFGCPEGTDAMLQFCGTFRHHVTRNAPGLALVHCSAGVGRTGTLIGLDILLQHIQENKKVDIFGTVYKLRKQRTNMVQTEGQYAYIYKCIKDALRDSSIFKQENSPTNSLEPIYENVPTKLATFLYEKLPDTKGKINSSESECEL